MRDRRESREEVNMNDANVMGMWGRADRDNRLQLFNINRKVKLLGLKEEQ